ncbi:hypothetical protein, partial [Sinorhizobium fredii]|uniref:hypothetical protein n=1 Tax=Rhizobium fredii TaxID=380 RepID=UPI001AEDCCF8
SLRKALGAHEPSPAQRYEIQRLLHGLEAITRLHFAQELETIDCSRTSSSCEGTPQGAGWL